MKCITALLSILMLFLTMNFAAFAADMDMSNMPMDSTSNAHPTEIEAIGIVDGIDEGKGIITISHEAIKSLNWPAMTMKFTVQNAKLISKLSKGKKIHFSFIQQPGKYVITEVK